MVVGLVAFLAVSLWLPVGEAASSTTPITARWCGQPDGLSAEPIPYERWHSLMIVSSHPDDIETCMGGLVYLLTQSGVPVYYVILTNGDKGCGNPSICENLTAPEIASLRQQETITAAAILGVPSSNIYFLGYEDAELTTYPEEDIRKNIIQLMREVRPEVVITWYLFPRFELQPGDIYIDLGYHPDHQQTGKLVLESLFDAGVSRLYPELGESHYILEFYMWEFCYPSHYFQMTKELLSKAASAEAAHESQCLGFYEVEAGMYRLYTATAKFSNVTTCEMATGFTQYSEITF
ncbi:LmbE family protein [Pelomyxa schiedti]|nr:LmbE family protein [Pelomyxa schiedti]